MSGENNIFAIKFGIVKEIRYLCINKSKTLWNQRLKFGKRAVLITPTLELKTQVAMSAQGAQRKNVQSRLPLILRTRFLKLIRTYSGYGMGKKCR